MRNGKTSSRSWKQLGRSRDSPYNLPHWQSANCILENRWACVDVLINLLDFWYDMCLKKQLIGQRHSVAECKWGNCCLNVPWEFLQNSWHSMLSLHEINIQQEKNSLWERHSRKERDKIFIIGSCDFKTIQRRIMKKNMQVEIEERIIHLH